MSDFLNEAKKRVANYGSRPHSSTEADALKKRKLGEEKLNRIFATDTFGTPNRPGGSFVPTFLHSLPNYEGGEAELMQAKIGYVEGTSNLGKLSEELWNRTEAWRRGPPPDLGDPAPAKGGAPGAPRRPGDKVINLSEKLNRGDSMYTIATDMANYESDLEVAAMGLGAAPMNVD